MAELEDIGETTHNTNTIVGSVQIRNNCRNSIDVDWVIWFALEKWVQRSVNKCGGIVIGDD